MVVYNYRQHGVPTRHIYLYKGYKLHKDITIKYQFKSQHNQLITIKMDVTTTNPVN